jgi:hypothetical protein
MQKLFRGEKKCRLRTIIEKKNEHEKCKIEKRKMNERVKEQCEQKNNNVVATSEQKREKCSIRCGNNKKMVGGSMQS